MFLIMARKGADVTMRTTPTVWAAEQLVKAFRADGYACDQILYLPGGAK